MADMSFPFIASKERMNELVEAKRAWSRRLLQPTMEKAMAFRASGVVDSPKPDQNVVGVGIGEKIVEGMPSGVLALKFLVRRKFPESEIGHDDLLPANVDGLPVDVEEVGTFRRLAGPPFPNPRIRYRPAQPGCSIGYHEPGQSYRMAGTFGVLVRREDRLYILSNNHVIADENNLPLGASIYQPGILDNGNVPTDRIANLSEFVPLDALSFNTVDAAIAELDDPVLASAEILHVGAPSGWANARRNMIVHKFGRTTSYTVGTITSLETDVVVSYESGNLTFEDQIVITGIGPRPFSAPGDSGSLIVERDSGLAVGLLFAGSATHTLANHLGAALQLLNVDLVK